MTSLLQEYPQLKTIQQLAQKKKLKVYLVGGFLRDSLAGKPKLDFDFAVEKNAIALARLTAKTLRGAFVLLDKDHGCARVVKKTPEGIQTFDFADFRAKTLKLDLAHRDFTVNTLCVDLNKLKDESLAQALLDHKGALRDFKARTIKMVAAGAFKEDPLRLLRAFSLQAALGFKIEPKTLSRIKKDKRLLHKVSIERVREELFKVLASDRAATTLKAMDRIGLLLEVIPQVVIMEKCTQGGYHHLDVWPHSLETVGQFEEICRQMQSDPDVSAYLNEPVGGDHPRFALIKLAALLHDIGKPETKKIEDGRTSFHSHEHVGKSIVRKVALMLKLSTDERHALEDMVQWHLRPGYLSNFKNPSERMIFRYFRDTKKEGAGILLLSLADQRSTRGPMTTEKDQKHHEKIALGLVQRFFEQQKQKPLVRLVSGHDLIRKLKLKPSPVFAKILRAIEEKQATGKISTKQEALDLAQAIARKI